MAGFKTDVDFSQSRGSEINLIGWVFTGIAIAAVGLKLFARGHMARDLGWDDFFIFFSMVRVWPSCAHKSSLITVKILSGS